MAEIYEVAQCFCESFMSGTYGLFAEVASLSNGCGIAESHGKTLLVDGVLAFGLGELFLAGISKQSALQLLIWHETGTDLMDVLTVLPLIFQLLGNVKVAQLGWLDQL